MRIKFTVKKEDRIDKVISCETEFSRSKITELIENNKCFVNGETENKKSLIVKSKSLIEIIIPDEIKEKKYMKIKYHFIDEDILVVDKPKNLITHKAGKNSQFSLIENILIDYPEIKSVGEIDRPGIVHRLDKDTTGLMIIARSEIGYEKLKPMIKNREVSRNYTALVYGKPNLEEAIIDAPISRDPKNPIKRKVLMGGKKSKTSYKIIDRFSDFSLLDVKLFSGRTHQIRVHLDHIGHSIVGDKLYGGKNSTLDRPFLHSSRLEFKHPISKDELIFNSELPKDLKGFLRDI